MEGMTTWQDEWEIVPLDIALHFDSTSPLVSLLTAVITSSSPQYKLHNFNPVLSASAFTEQYLYRYNYIRLPRTWTYPSDSEISPTYHPR